MFCQERFELCPSRCGFSTIEPKAARRRPRGFSEDLHAHVGPPAPPRALAVLTEDHLRTYQRDGFLHVKGFYAGSELKTLLERVANIQSKKEVVGGQMMWFEEGQQGQGRILNRVEDFCRRDEGMNSLFMAEGSKMVGACADLTGDDVVLFKDKINFKLAGGDGFKAHQDQQAGWGKYIDWFMSIGVFVDHSTIENGCLEVARGLHKQGLLGEEWVPLSDLDLPYEYVECAPGDAIFFDSYVPHRSGPNTSTKPRRAVFVTYNKKSKGFRLPAYYEDKRRDFPPDIERPEGKTYVYRV